MTSPSAAAAAADAIPPGAKPVVVFFAPAQLEAAALQAEDEGLDVQALVRRAVRTYLRQHVGDGIR